MKVLKSIFLLTLIFNTTIIFSQNKKVNYQSPSPQNLPPSPDFSWLNACMGDSTCFINQTIRGNTYTWTVTEDTAIGPFGLVVSKTLLTSYDTNICFRFWKPGTYTVSLSAYNNHFVTTTKILTIDTITKADFSFVICSNNFVNNSYCASSFYWDFGDGTHSTQTLPIHQYADTGHYNVTLIVYKGTVSDTMKKQIVVSVNSFASAAYNYTVLHDTLLVHALYSGVGTNYYWSWSDGTYSTGQDTVHIYKDSTATYAVGLVDLNSCGPAFNTTSIIISPHPAPQPNFSFKNTCFGDTACFINQTLGGVTYTWTVTDSVGHHTSILYTSNNDSGFCFHFPAIGNYSITLAANNIFYTVSFTQKISIDTLPKANFSFNQCSNDFVNIATCASSFYWDFGDGTSSILSTPTHQYADTGYYNVTLIAYEGIKSDTLKKQIHINVTSLANASFTAISSNDTVWVHANYSGVPNAVYHWSFGDGSHATGKDTTHVYADTVFSYKVNLTVHNLCGSVSKTDTLQISVPEPPAHLNFSNTNLTIAPNPISNEDYLDAFYNAYTDDNYLAQVYNSLGQKMFEEYFSFQRGINEFKINTSGFSDGVYMLALQSGNSFIRKKFYVVNKQ